MPAVAPAPQAADGGQIVRSQRGDVHVLPPGPPQHDSSSLCWCGPELDYESPETGNKVWLHRETH